MKNPLQTNYINKRVVNQGGRTQLTQDYSSSLMNLETMRSRLNTKGGTDQWIRMRQDKLKNLRRALYYSYQAAVVQPYSISVDTLTKNIISIISVLQLFNSEQYPISETQLNLLLDLEADDPVLAATAAEAGRYTSEYIALLNQIVDNKAQPYFRALINHDKLKVDYQDKILSIPFDENSVLVDSNGQDRIIKDNEDWLQTNFHSGTVFKWIHGNKQEWVPDTYWIVYLQYSEQTAYFRGQIRRADDEVSIVLIGPDGEQEEQTYRGWTTGPNETSTLWNVKKGVVWNDLNYKKLLYITKDENTLAYFKRFDKIKVNGEYWEVLAYNENYGNTKDKQYGVIRVALGESYTPTKDMIKQLDKASIEEEIRQDEKNAEDEASGKSYIDGPDVAYPDDVIICRAKNLPAAEWAISDPKLAKIESVSEDGITAKIRIITLRSNKQGFDITYGNESIHVTIKSM